MFQKMLKKLLFWRLQKQNNSADKPDPISEQALSPELEINLNTLRGILGLNYDFVIREFSFSLQGNRRCALLFLKGMTDDQKIDNQIIKPLTLSQQSVNPERRPGQSDIQALKSILSAENIREITKVEEVLTGYFSGNTVLFLDGNHQALLIETKHFASRAIDEPKTETIIRGPREGFTENILANTSLLRRKIQSRNLVLENMIIGRQTNTIIIIAYLSGVADAELIREIKRRLNLIKTDAILESGYIEQFIEDSHTSIFSTVGNSEKPDVIAAKILEGRAAIFVDGTPIVLTVPMLFWESFQSAEDYYSRPQYTSILRLIRFLSFLISIFFPAAYVAFMTFHQELIPTTLLFTMAAQEETSPFPTFIVVLTMGIVFEILREAGIRLPRPAGQAISIVGALVIGDAAVNAGLISASIVIVVSLTAVASFVVPPQADSGTILRLFFLFLAGIMGGYGIFIGFISILIHLSALSSFGTPYLFPLAPLNIKHLKDTFIRAPLPVIARSPLKDKPAKQNSKQSPNSK